MGTLPFGRISLAGLLALLAVFAIACGTAATPTTAPRATAAAPTAVNTPLPIVVATPGPTVTPKPTGIVSAKDSITLVMPEEPSQINPFQSIGASTNAYVTRDNVAEPLTWQSGDDQRVVPTTATESWSQTAPNTWRFKLRQGVKFTNGEAYNAQAAVPSLAYLGVGANNNSSFPYTSGFKPAAIDEYTLDIVCDQACPIFPNTAFFAGVQAPGYLQANPTIESRTRSVIGFGPYVLKEWTPGVSITQEANPNYVTVGNHYEFQKPAIKNVKWVWRNETTVMTAMIKAGEADLAWDAGVDSAKSLAKENIAFGSSAEVFAFTINTLWHPELKKKEVRQAINHAVNCQELINAVYNGLTECVGNIIWDGVTGSTKANTAPYKYDPAKAKELLKQANYDPKVEIGIYGRSARIPKQVEVYEAYHSYLTQVGINAKIYVIEPGVRTSRTTCGIGKSVNQVITDRGGDPAKDKPTMDDFKKGVEKGSLCPYGDLMENEPSNETLDFGRQANFYMSCVFPRSLVCDTAPGGFQEQLPMALAASGTERQAAMQKLADKMHDDALFVFGFKLPVVYGKNAKLNFKPRFDGRIRVNHLWFNQ